MYLAGTDFSFRPFVLRVWLGMFSFWVVSILVFSAAAYAAPTPTAVTQDKGVLKVAAPATESSELQLTGSDYGHTFTITSLDATKTTLSYTAGQGCSKPDLKKEEVVCVLERNASIVNEIKVTTGNQPDIVKLNFPYSSRYSYEETFPRYVAGKVPLAVDTGAGQDQISLDAVEYGGEHVNAEAEANSTLTAGSGNDTVTVAVASTALRSTYTDPQRMAIDLGSGEDTLNASKTNALPLLVIPGPGVEKDDITGSNSHYDNDVNIGYLDSDAGDKFLADSSPDGNDIFYSPSGEAEVSYEKRTAGVKVSLDGTDNDGDIATGEKDNVKPSIQTVVGSSADDVLDVTVTGLLSERIFSRRAYGKVEMTRLQRGTLHLESPQ